MRFAETQIKREYRMKIVIEIDTLSKLISRSWYLMYFCKLHIKIVSFSLPVHENF